MKETIWKYSLKIYGLNKLNVPKDSEVLCVQIQDANPCIWVKVNPGNKKECRSFIIFGTGFKIDILDIEKKYIGTFQLGSFVGHLFELLKKS
jgi:hypothetical protein